MKNENIILCKSAFVLGICFYLKGNMQNDDTIKFACSHCGQSIEAPAAMRGKEIDCPGCWRKVTVCESLSAGELSASKENTKSEAAVEAQPGPDRLRDIAGTFEVVARWLMVIGCLALGFFLLCAVAALADESNRVVWPVYVGAAAFGFAMWLFLMAQLMYIRAALEK